jgi:hypothetical protein
LEATSIITSKRDAGKRKRKDCCGCILERNRWRDWGKEEDANPMLGVVAAWSKEENMKDQRLL